MQFSVRIFHSSFRNATVSCTGRGLIPSTLLLQTAMNLELHRGYQEARAIQQATRAEVRSALQAILESHKEMSKLLATSENSLQPVNAVMMRLQEVWRSFCCALTQFFHPYTDVHHRNSETRRLFLQNRTKPSGEDCGRCTRKHLASLHWLIVSPLITVQS